MAKVPLKLGEMIDGDALRAELTAFTAGHDGDGSSPQTRGQSAGDAEGTGWPTAAPAPKRC